MKNFESFFILHILHSNEKGRRIAAALENSTEFSRYFEALAVAAAFTIPLTGIVTTGLILSFV